MNSIVVTLVTTVIVSSNATAFAMTCERTFRSYADGPTLASLRSSTPTEDMNRVPILATLKSGQERPTGLIQKAKDALLLNKKALDTTMINGTQALNVSVTATGKMLFIHDLLKNTRLLDATNGERKFPLELLVQFPVAQLFANFKWVKAPIVAPLGGTVGSKTSIGPKFDAFYAMGESGQYLVEVTFLPIAPYEHAGVLLRSRSHNDLEGTVAIAKAAAVETRKKYPEFTVQMSPMDVAVSGRGTASALYLHLDDKLGVVRTAYVLGGTGTLELESANSLFLRNLFELLAR